VNRVNGKVAVVTGGASGIGRATCELLAREGARVAITDIQDELGNAAAAAIERSGATAEFWHVDVRIQPEIERAFADIEKRFGGIDILVNNAGISGADKPTDELDQADWDEVQAVNVKGVFLCTKHAVPRLLRRGGGSIVNLSSIYGLVGTADSPPYHASKAAVRIMSKTDALLYARRGIRVNSVHPGFIRTPLLERNVGGDPDILARLEQLHPVGRLGTPEDVANAILFLASDESRFVTGSELVVDGGYTAR
jgi:NAD(P)-dependent dehydrogenase (short-subunit alcohol dehydrogenase family)